MSEIIVWYDGACPLCVSEIAFMDRLDKENAIMFIDLMEPEASCPVDRSLMLVRFHASEDGQLLSGAAAFAAMWRAIPLLRPLGQAARLPGALPLLELVYKLFLRVRPQLQQWAGGRISA